MKFCLILLVMIASIPPAIAQQSFYNVDERILAMPDSQAVTTEAIANYIKNNFSNDADRTRAAYTWVVRNIKYDTDSMYAINWNMGGSLKITESFRRRKGVCENFAGIFIDIVSKSGLQGITIPGYTKQANIVNKTGHTWSAVNIDGSWHLFDPTWDKDRVGDYHFFMAQPASFASSHMPFDPLWQFTDLPATHRQFLGQNGGRIEIIKNHVDSIKAFVRMSELEKLEATERRMKNNDKTSDLIKNRVAFLQMQIGTIYEERDMKIYNAGVADLNKATEAYNKFVLQINSAGSLSDFSREYVMDLEPSLDLLSTSLISVNEIGKYVPSFQYDPTELKMRMAALAHKIRLIKPQSRKLTRS